MTRVLPPRASAGNRRRPRSPSCSARVRRRRGRALDLHDATVQASGEDNGRATSSQPQRLDAQRRAISAAHRPRAGDRRPAAPRTGAAPARRRPPAKERSGYRHRSPRRARRPERSPLPGQHVAAASGLARRREGSARREGAGADRRSQFAREELRRGERAAAAKSADFIWTVVRESEPSVGKDGLMSMTTEAVVNVKARAEVAEPDDARRAHRGDPRERRPARSRCASPCATPTVRRAAAAVAGRREPAQGAHQDLRLPHLDGGRRPRRSDGGRLLVTGEAKVRKLSTRLEASGLVVTKYALTSWTVKCVDRATGEEIYFNTALPKGIGSWAGEGEAMTRSARRSPTSSRAISSCSTSRDRSARIARRERSARRECRRARWGVQLSRLPAVIAARPKALAPIRRRGSYGSPAAVQQGTSSPAAWFRH